MEDVLYYRQESVARPKDVKVLLDQINECLDGEDYGGAEKILVQLKKILGEENTEYKEMAGIVNDAKIIGEC